jgi:iron complex outermembrane recepter protein
VTACGLRGSRNVRAETLASLEAGYRTLVTSAMYVDAVAFQHRYDDIVALGAPVVDFPTRHGTAYQRVSFPFTNGVEGPTRGFEIAPSVTAMPGVTVRGSYSLLWTDLRRKPGIPDNQFTALILEGSPRHQVVVQGLASKGRLDISPAYRYVSERRATEIPGYHELDVPVSWTLTPSLTLALVGQNLLHAHHAEWARDPGPTVEIKRSVYVRLIWRR